MTMEQGSLYDFIGYSESARSITTLSLGTVEIDSTIQLGTFFQVAATVLVALIAIYGARSAYRRQKEHELVKERYLDNGIDQVAAAAEGALRAFHHNWQRASEILRHYRDNPEFDLDELRSGYYEFPRAGFEFLAQHRVRRLIDDEIAWDSFQLVVAFAGSASAFATNEIPEVVREFRYSKVKITPMAATTPARPPTSSPQAAIASICIAISKRNFPDDTVRLEWAQQRRLGATSTSAIRCRADPIPHTQDSSLDDPQPSFGNPWI